MQSQRRECSGEGTFGTVLYFCFYMESQIIVTKGIPESYRLCLMFLVCAKLYDFNLMGTKEGFFFLFFSLCLECSFSVIFFNKADVQCVLGAEIEPML